MKKKPLTESDRQIAERMANDVMVNMPGLTYLAAHNTYDCLVSSFLRAIRIGRKRGEKHAVALAKRAIELRDLLHTVPTKPTS